MKYDVFVLKEGDEKKSTEKEEKEKNELAGSKQEVLQWNDIQSVHYIYCYSKIKSMWRDMRITQLKK